MYMYEDFSVLRNDEFMEMFEKNEKEFELWKAEKRRRQQEIEFKESTVYQALCSLYRIYRADYFGKCGEAQKEIADYKARFQENNKLEQMLDIIKTFLSYNNTKQSEPSC